jgi:ribosomal protein S21
MPVVVKSQLGDSSDQVIRKFKKKVLHSQLLTDLKEREFYKKPSRKKQEKMAEFKRRKKRRLRLRWARQR